MSCCSSDVCDLRTMVSLESASTSCAVTDSSSDWSRVWRSEPSPRPRSDSASRADSSESCDSSCLRRRSPSVLVPCRCKNNEQRKRNFQHPLQTIDRPHQTSIRGRVFPNLKISGLVFQPGRSFRVTFLNSRRVENLTNNLPFLLSLLPTPISVPELHEMRKTRSIQRTNDET